MFNNILTDIDSATNESEAYVLEAMLITYNKAYDILSNTDDPDESVDNFPIIQEAVVQSGEAPEEVSSEFGKKKKDNVFVRILDTIIKFFKNIGRTISNFFKKTKDTVVEKLRKFSKKSTDNVPDDVQKKADKISEKRSQRHNEKIKDANVDKSKSSDNGSSKDKTTGIVIKERKIRTRIKFKIWIEYLTNLENQLDMLIDNKIDIAKSKNKTHLMFSLFSHKYNASEVADYVETLLKLFKSVNLKLDTATDKLSKVLNYYKSSTKSVNKDSSVHWYFKNDKDRKKIERHIRNISDNITNAAVLVQNMTAYLADELDIYNIILDTIEPVIERRAEEATKAAAEKDEAKKSANAQRVEVVVKKDE